MVNLQIERGKVTVDCDLIIFVRLLLVALTVVMIVTMLTGVDK